jgi:hypothetical protein
VEMQQREAAVDVGQEAHQRSTPDRYGADDAATGAPAPSLAVDHVRARVRSRQGARRGAEEGTPPAAARWGTAGVVARNQRSVFVRRQPATTVQRQRQGRQCRGSEGTPHRMPAHGRARPRLASRGAERPSDRVSRGGSWVMPADIRQPPPSASHMTGPAAARPQHQHQQWAQRSASGATEVPQQQRRQRQRCSPRLDSSVSAHCLPPPPISQDYSYPRQSAVGFSHAHVHRLSLDFDRRRPPATAAAAAGWRE